MHCPCCGAETSLDQRFCRSCGMDLEAVSKLVVAHSSPEAPKLEKGPSKRDQKGMPRPLRFGLNMFILGMAVLFITKALEFPWPFNLVGSLLLFLAMGLMFYRVLTRKRDGGSRSRMLPGFGRSSELQEPEIAKELPSARFPLPVASVTDRTTQLISTEKTGMPRE